MQEITFSYSEEEQGWVSEELNLAGKALLLIRLQAKGRIVIRRHRPDDTKPKIHITKNGFDYFEFTFGGDGTIDVVASVEPKYMKYIYLH